MLGSVGLGEVGSVGLGEEGVEGGAGHTPAWVVAPCEVGKEDEEKSKLNSKMTPGPMK